MQFDLVWYSDDNGKSYQLSESVLEKMDEAQLVEGAGGVVVANMRNNHLTSCKCRATAISKNGGMNFGDIAYDPTLISPVVYYTLGMHVRACHMLHARDAVDYQSIPVTNMISYYNYYSMQYIIITYWIIVIRRVENQSGVAH